MSRAAISRPAFLLLWGRMASCARPRGYPGNRRRLAGLRGVQAGYQPAAGCQPAPQLPQYFQYGENYVALTVRECLPATRLTNAPDPEGTPVAARMGASRAST